MRTNRKWVKEGNPLLLKKKIKDKKRKEKDPEAEVAHKSGERKLQAINKASTRNRCILFGIVA